LVIFVMDSEKSRPTAPHWRHQLLAIATCAVASVACRPAIASNFSGDLPVGYSDSIFQIGGSTSLMIDISASGVRDPSLCPSCDSSYTDNYTVNLFNQAGSLLASTSETNYLYYSLVNGGSHGIGAGPVGVSVPAGATTLEIISQLYITGLLGADGQPLSFGNLNISTYGSLTAATPLPSTLPLLASGLAALGLLGWRSGRKARAPLACGSGLNPLRRHQA
jgi:hypothetical protein